MDGDWGQWGAWASCTKSCAGGEMIRIRKCDSPAPDHDGKMCPGTEQDTIACNEKLCPGNNYLLFIGFNLDAKILILQRDVN